MMDKDRNARNGIALDRRAVMTAAVAATAVAALAPASVSAAGRKLDVNNPADARQIVRKLRYRTDEGILFWWIRGQYMADQDASLTPLYGMIFGSLQHVTQRADGGFDVRQMELGFRTDLETGKQLSTMRNPLTNQMIDVPFAPIGPTMLHYSPDAIPTVPREMGGSEIDFVPLPQKPFIAQDKVFLPFRARSRVRTPGFTDRIINDISMIQGPAAQTLDPRVTSVDAWVDSSDITSFPRWMKMGDTKGTLTLRGVGAKVMKIGDMPADWLDMMERYDPTILADPIAALQRPHMQYKG